MITFFCRFLIYKIMEQFSKLKPGKLTSEEDKVIFKDGHIFVFLIL